MNIFYLHESPTTAAEYMCDKHVVKMILESAQLLCTAHHVCPSDAERPEKFYKSTHVNHPCSVWVRACVGNYSWLRDHAYALLDEYTHRYGKKHASTPVIDWCGSNNPDIPSGKFTDVAQCMPEEYKANDPVIAYRDYYNKAKSHLHSWKNRQVPDWISHE
jgi:hypothetical protein|tara:strand:+ start:80 stop:562 length:483 start_codon:yes stop_codon:yes gene_type:complete